MSSHLLQLSCNPASQWGLSSAMLSKSLLRNLHSRTASDVCCWLPLRFANTPTSFTSGQGMGKSGETGICGFILTCVHGDTNSLCNAAVADASGCGYQLMAQTCHDYLHVEIPSVPTPWSSMLWGLGFG